MKRVLVAAVLSALSSTAFASTFGPLVEAQELASANNVTPVLLDIRGSYDDGHAEGAISAPYGLFRGPAENPGQVVDVEALETSLEQLGLEQSQPIVIMSDGQTSTDFGAAARVYWTLKSTGFEDLSVLNGGFAAWEGAGLPVSTIATTLEPSELELTFDKTWLAETSDVSRVVNGEIEAVLVDARLEDFFTGDRAHQAAKQPGTLPGAINHAFTAFFKDESPAISQIDDPAALRAELGIEEDQEVISFCNTGHWAAAHWFAVSEMAGVKNAKLYAGSMVEYSNAGLPMENTPGLLQNLLNQIGN